MENIPFVQNACDGNKVFFKNTSKSARPIKDLSVSNTRLTKQSADVDVHSKVFINPLNIIAQLEDTGRAVGEVEV